MRGLDGGNRQPAASVDHVPQVAGEYRHCAAPQHLLHARILAAPAGRQKPPDQSRAMTPPAMPSMHPRISRASWSGRCTGPQRPRTLHERFNIGASGLYLQHPERLADWSMPVVTADHAPRHPGETDSQPAPGLGADFVALSGQGILAAARSPADGPALIHGTEDSHAIAPQFLKPMCHDARSPPRDIVARSHAAIESALADAQVIEHAQDVDGDDPQDGLRLPAVARTR